MSLLDARGTPDAGAPEDAGVVPAAGGGQGMHADMGYDDGWLDATGSPASSAWLSAGPGMSWLRPQEGGVPTLAVVTDGQEEEDEDEDEDEEDFGGSGHNVEEGVAHKDRGSGVWPDEYEGGGEDGDLHRWGDGDAEAEGGDEGAVVQGDEGEETLTEGGPDRAQGGPVVGPRGLAVTEEDLASMDDDALLAAAFSGGAPAGGPAGDDLPDAGAEGTAAWPVVGPLDSGEAVDGNDDTFQERGRPVPPQSIYVAPSSRRGKPAISMVAQSSSTTYGRPLPEAEVDLVVLRAAAAHNGGLGGAGPSPAEGFHGVDAVGAAGAAAGGTELSWAQQPDGGADFDAEWSAQAGSSGGADMDGTEAGGGVVDGGAMDRAMTQVWGRRKTSGRSHTPAVDAVAGASGGLPSGMLTDPRVVEALRVARQAGVDDDVAVRLVRAALEGPQLQGAGPGPGQGAGRGEDGGAASEGSHRASDTVAVVATSDGRHKVVKLRGRELWTLGDVRGKLLFLGAVVSAARRRRREVVAARLGLLGTLAGLGKRRRRGRAACVLFAAGVAAGARRTRVTRRCQPLLFALGHTTRQLRLLREAAAAAERARQKRDAKAAARLAKAEASKVRQVRWGVLKQDDLSSQSMWGRRASDQPFPSAASGAADDVDSLLDRVTDTFSRSRAKPQSAPAGGEPKPAKPTKVSLITDAKVKRQCDIGIGGVLRGTTMEQLAAAIEGVNSEALGGRDAAEALLTIAEGITEATEQEVAAFDGDETKLDTAERFVLCCLVRVPQARQRLGLAARAASADGSLSLVQERCTNILGACAEVKGSWRLRFLLRDVVVPLGNKLNAGSQVGQAAGVRIDTLSSLVQTRAASGETFLRFVVEGLMTSDDGADLLHVVDDFPSVTGTPFALFTWEPIRAELADLRACAALARTVMAAPR